MKNKMLVIIASFVVLLLATSVSEAKSKCAGHTGKITSTVIGTQEKPPENLTEEQQGAWHSYQERTLQLRREYLTGLVQNGILTKTQVEARIKLMEAIFSFRTKNRFFGPETTLEIKFTEKQKVEMRELFKQRTAYREEALAALVAAGKITKGQADSQLERMQYRFDYYLENGFESEKGEHGLGIGPDGLGGGFWF